MGLLAVHQVSDLACCWVLPVLVGWTGGDSRWGSLVLSPRSDLSALDRCARGCLVDGDFHQVNGRHLCRNLPSQYPVSRDLLVLLVHFVGGPLSWVASHLLHLIRNQE